MRRQKNKEFEMFFITSFSNLRIINPKTLEATANVKLTINKKHKIFLTQVVLISLILKPAAV
jgi:hypothetical protein